MSVFDFLKINGFQPFPEKHIQDFARSLLQSVQCEWQHDMTRYAWGTADARSFAQVETRAHRLETREHPPGEQ